MHRTGSAGCSTSSAARRGIIERAPGRPNLIARVRGRRRGAAAAAAGSRGRRRGARASGSIRPFAGELARRLRVGPRRARHEGRRRDDARRVHARRARRARAARRRDPVRARRRGGRQRPRREFLVREHPELFAGVRYAIGEFGGFTMRRRRAALLPDHGRREAGVLDARAAAAGAPGHGSLPVRGRRDGPARPAARAARPAPPAGPRHAGRARDDRGARRAELPRAAGAAAARAARCHAHRPAARRAGRARRGCSTRCCTTRRAPTIVARRREDQRDPRRGRRGARLPPAARLRSRGAVRRAARARRAWRWSSR